MKKEIEFPDCWEELTTSEWVYLLHLRRKLEARRGLTLIDVKREWCRFVLHGRGCRPKTKEDYFILIDNLAQSLNWMWVESEDGKQVALDFNSTQNLLPVWRELCGPLSHGGDLAFAEFRVAVSLINEYNRTHQAETLQILCGVLYRKPGATLGKENFDGNYREEFNPARTSWYAARVQMMPPHIQWGVYAWFAYFCNYLLTGTFIIEGIEVCFAPLFARSGSDGGASGQNNLGLHAIGLSVAESGVFGNAEQTDRTLLLKIMLKLLNDYQRAEALQKKN
ncbi:hypothetical protein EZS27_022869 [termite gut metagenome]|uniref:Uncharacterized protein n=1 Tax=termite gut metagenome TaxID=433724 RepID=A0A5J4R3C2_9ZZZZ